MLGTGGAPANAVLDRAARGPSHPGRAGSPAMFRVQRQARAGVPGCRPLSHRKLRAAASVGFGASAQATQMNMAAAAMAESPVNACVSLRFCCKMAQDWLTLGFTEAHARYNMRQPTSVSVAVAARTAAAAFWTGVLAGAFAACSVVAIAQAYSLVQLSVPETGNSRHLLYKNELDQREGSSQA